jgi:4'-phosphopantetheinyl transferase EntD
VSVVADALADLGARLPAAVAVAAERVTDPGRDGERAAGRRAAQRALHAAGCDGERAIGRAPDGRPLWPAGFTGSVAHTRTSAVAAVAAVGGLAGSDEPDAVAALGIDIETSAALDPRDAALVLDDRERALVGAHRDPAWLATLLWSAKEAAFKAWSVQIGGLEGVDPLDIHVDVDERTGAVTVTGCGRLETTVPGPAVGHYAESDGLVLTLVRVSAAGRAAG